MIERRTVIVLVLASIGCGAAWLTHDRGASAPPGTRGEGSLLTLDRLPLEQITRIRLVRGRDAPLEFARLLDGSWAQTDPFPHAMDPFSIRQLAIAALELNVAERIGPDEMGDLSPTSLSLDPPRAMVTYGWPGGELTLALGRLGIAGRAYLQVQGDPDVYVVTQGLHDRAIEMDPREWRDRGLFRLAGADADAIRIFHRPQGRVETRSLVQERKRWRLEVEQADRTPAAVRTRADPDARDALLQWLGGAKSSGFIEDQPDDLGRFGLDDPMATITVEATILGETDGQITRTSGRERLLIGSPMGGSQDHFAMLEEGDTVFRLAAETLATLPMLELLADPTGCDVDPADVKFVEIRGAGGGLVLERDLDFDSAAAADDDVHRWLAPDHGRAEVPRRLAEELLQQLTTVRAPRVRIQTYPADLEVAVITLKGYDRAPLATIRVAREVESSEWAFENGDDVLRIFPGSMVLRLTPAEFGL